MPDLAGWNVRRPLQRLSAILSSVLAQQTPHLAMAAGRTREQESSSTRRTESYSHGYHQQSAPS